MTRSSDVRYRLNMDYANAAIEKKLASSALVDILEELEFNQKCGKVSIFLEIYDREGLVKEIQKAIRDHLRKRTDRT